MPARREHILLLRRFRLKVNQSRPDRRIKTARELVTRGAGEILMEEFLTPMSLSQNRLALALGVPARRINEIVLEKRGISADTALRLSAYFGNSAEFWLGLQMDYDLDCARIEVGSSIEKDVRKRA